MTDPTTDSRSAAPADDGGTSVTDSGNVAASNGGFGNSGVIEGGVRHEHHEHHHAAPASPVVWPVQIGRPPALASAFQPREGLRAQIHTARHDGADVVLTQHTTNTAADVLAGGGGVGKTQLAAWFAHHAIKEQSVDLVMWVPAGAEEQVITSYARAAARLSVPGANGSDPLEDAAAFCEWLHTTNRRWLIVLDDITNPSHLTRWWPPASPGGWTLATTRQRSAALTGSGRRRIDIDVYTPDESMAYLTERLTSEHITHLLDDRTADLAETVGHLPLALAHAAAYMINEAETCSSYLNRYTDGRQRLIELMPAEADPDAYGRPIDVTLLLNIDAANQSNPIGLAQPALELVALLDPAGHPDTLWTTEAVTGYLTNHRTQPGEPVTTDQAHAALRLLHRYGILTHTPTDGPRAVRIHALTARAAREHPTTNPAATARTAADALLHRWPTTDHTLETAALVQSLRANANLLHIHTGPALWQPDAHPLPFTAGNSLLRAGLHTAATTHWHTLAQQAQHHLGPDHPDTITARAGLAHAYVLAGRIAEATTIREQVLTDSERILGPDHPATITARANLASSYWHAGRTNDATTIEEQVLTDRERILGTDHPDTIRARANVAACYWQAGRTTDAITIDEQVLTDRERVLGTDHPDTIRARANLATSYHQADRTTDATIMREQVLTDRERILGTDHPDTINARANLATSYRQAGRTKEAINLLRTVVDDRKRVLGPQHPDTITAIATLRDWTSSK